MTQPLIRAVLDGLDDDALDELARRLAPRLQRAAPPGEHDPLDVAAAARLAGVSPRTIRRAITAGLLDARQVAGRWQTTPAQVTTWLSEGGPTRLDHMPAPRPAPAPRRPTARKARADSASAAILGDLAA